VAVSSNVAYYEGHVGNLGAAREHLYEALPGARAVGEFTLVTNTALHLGFLGLSDAHPDEAKERFAEVLAEAKRPTPESKPPMRFSA
jgi:hypothetical protein